MKILIIGGTKFVGRKIVEEALAAKHDISLFNRGQTNQQLFADAQKYVGDRNQIQDILPSTEKWDVVVDTCGYHPEIVKKSTEFLKDKADLYIFISTCSVYADMSYVGLDESSQVSEIKIIPPVEEKLSLENYGALKVLCERAVVNSFGSARALILRPSIIVGSYDNTKRFDDLIKALLTQTKLEVPEDRTAPLQFIDVRALSQFVLMCARQKKSGIYNLVGPRKPISYLELIEKAKEMINPNLKLIFSDKAKENSPLYIEDLNWRGLFKINGEKAYEAGLLDISVEETILETAKYQKSLIVS